MRIILGMEVGNREEDAKKVQGLLTEYGCSIKTRLGMHEAGNLCSSMGLILIEFAQGHEEKAVALEAELRKLESVKVGKMEF